MEKMQCSEFGNGMCNVFFSVEDTGYLNGRERLMTIADVFNKTFTRYKHVMSTVNESQLPLGIYLHFEGGLLLTICPIE